MVTVSAIYLFLLQQYLHLVARDPWLIVICFFIQHYTNTVHSVSCKALLAAIHNCVERSIHKWGKMLYLSILFFKYLGSECRVSHDTSNLEQSELRVLLKSPKAAVIAWNQTLWPRAPTAKPTVSGITWQCYTWALFMKVSQKIIVAYMDLSSGPGS